ncbi:MAG: hypothetical protein JXR94_23175 [Candidatus Hydrogenedentes bacterium]|nr:hypothetical protein [Candidatus Hydrogenedentota bacterium]
MNTNDLPMGPAPAPVSFPHFPDRLHAYVWKNWPFVPAPQLAKVVGATADDIERIAGAMGLSVPQRIPAGLLDRAYVTVLRRNWHLLPYDQLCALFDWTPDRMAYVLREGDGLFWWFGQYKPRLEPLHYREPGEAEQRRAAEIAATVRAALPDPPDRPDEPPFGFVAELCRPPASAPAAPRDNVFSPRFCYSYFAQFRNPLLGEQDPYPDGYLARLAAAGVDGIILHEPLYHLSPFPWDPAVSDRYEERRDALRRLVDRTAKHGLGVYLYMNEPRPMPMAFFEQHPELRGVVDVDVQPGQQATLCTSVPEVKAYIREAVAALCRAVPGLAGMFTITASESYTNCWSHHRGHECARCAKRSPEEVIAEVNTLFREGMRAAGSDCRLMVWDWGWNDAWAEGIIERLPEDAWFMSVSEWSTPIERGGVASAVGEYALSVVGPGPRATRHWGFARRRGLKTVAKIQMSTTWELGAVPYIPAVANIASHAGNLRRAGVDGLMLSWTLGSYPSPNVEAVMAMGERGKEPSVDEALVEVATRRFGVDAAPAVAAAWRAFSTAFREYPFHIQVLYRSPVHMGPANLLWAQPTGYYGHGTMGFGYPFDDVDTWRGIYPPDVFAEQFEKVAGGFQGAIDELRRALAAVSPAGDASRELDREIGVAEACAIHFRSVANQVRFVLARDALALEKEGGQRGRLLDELEALLLSEIDLAARLHAIQHRDSRIGFESACRYFYVGVDLAEKIVNCRHLLAEWIPAERAAGPV